MTNATFDYGDLRVTLTKDHTWKWDSSGVSADKVTMYNANVQSPMRPLGSTGMKSIDGTLNGTIATLLVGVNPNTSPARPAVAAPTDYTQLRWMKFTHEGSCWRPTAPAGYVSCGDLWNYTKNKPSVNDMWCLREDLAGYGRYSDNRLWGFGGGAPMSAWFIVPENPGVEGTASFPLNAGTFRLISSLNKPDEVLARVPTIPLPNRLERFVAPIPEFTDATRPQVGDTFGVTQQASVTLPFNALLPSTDQVSLEKIRNPFIKFSRVSKWYVEALRRNGNKADDVLVQELTKGVNSSKTTEMTNSAGINITASGGIKAVSYEVSLNYQFTYTSTSSFGEYSESKTTETVTVPPNVCAILLTQRIYLKAERGDGTVSLSSMNMPVNGAVYWVSYYIDPSKAPDATPTLNPKTNAA